MKSTNVLSRRKFLKISGAGSAVLAVGFYFTTGCDSKKPVIANMSLDKNSLASLNPFVLINDKNQILIMAHKPEMGQGTFQSMPMIIAEELDVTLNDIFIEQAMSDQKYGDQSVGGSFSVRGNFEMLRKTGASAREMLILAAAKKFGVQPSDCYTKDKKVFSRSKEKHLNYGQLVDEASKIEAPQEPTLKDRKNFKIIGKSLPRPDIQEKVNGKAIFGLDVKVPGMLYASVEHAPVLRASVVEFDDSETKFVPGVKHVLQVERQVFDHTYHGVGVLADNYWAALQGRKKLRIKWDNGDFDKVNTENIYRDFKKLAGQDGIVDVYEGNFETEYRRAKDKIEADYEMPFVAHSPMEPQNVVIHVRENECEVWAPTQVPDSVRRNLAKYLNIPEENIIIHITYLGGGFGRRLFVDPIMEAAFMSKSVKTPVKLIWTREDDTSQGPFRPGTYSRLRGALDEKKQILAFQHKVVAPSIGVENFGRPIEKEVGSAMEGVSEMPYKIPHKKTNYIYAKTTIPIGWWRSVYSSTTAFAHESFIDELAHLAGKDPMLFRLEMLDAGDPVSGILNRLAEISNWNQPLPENWGRGVAVWKFFAGKAGHVVKIARNNAGKILIKKIFCVIDVGLAINPDNIRNQTEGNIVMALTAALKHPITFKQGETVEKNFDRYEMLKIHETPEIQVDIIADNDKPDGVGEPGLPPLAPALGNALFDLTGIRLRKLPFDLENIA